MTPVRRDRRLLYAAGCLRTTAVGITTVVLARHLADVGLDVGATNVVVGLGLAGGAAATLGVGFAADGAGRRRTLRVLAALACAGGLGVALGTAGPWIGVAAFLGMTNAMGRDRLAQATVEQSILPATAPAERRTATFAVQSAALDLGHACGFLLGGLPVPLRALGVADLDAGRATLVLAAALHLGSLALYARLSPAVERATVPRPGGVSRASRGRVRRFAALSAVDSLGGGFLTGSLLGWWFFERFGADEATVGLLFAAGRLLNVASYAAAVALARRIGLVRTMVFSHVPAHLLVAALPFVPSFGAAVVVLLLRDALVEMDLPTRTSYLAAIVEPEERTGANALVNAARVSAWAVPSFLLGGVVARLGPSGPLWIGAGVKVVYDGLLFLGFRHVRPAEETGIGGPDAAIGGGR